MKKSPAVRYLGTCFDETLSSSKHVLTKCKAATWNLKCIRKLRHLIHQESFEILMDSIVLLHLDYGNGCLFWISDYLVKKMQRVKNFVARVVLNKSWNFSSLEALYFLHWLPVTAQIMYKIVCIVHKYLNDNAPIYLRNLLIHNKWSGSCSGLQCNDNENLLTIPYVKVQTFAWRPFSVCRPRLWNKLPKDAQNTAEYNHFKVKLKTHLFHKFVINEPD